jgi:GH24 family phage-related lysozyme (muramidase)
LGINVDLEVPPYMATYNSLPDDVESSFTQSFCCDVPTNAGTDGSLTICAGATVTSAQLLAALTGEDAGGSFLEALAGAGTYTYVVTATAPCVNDTSLVVVTEQAAPNAGTDGTLTICAGTTVTSAQLLAALAGEDAGGSFVEALSGAGTYTYVVTATAPCVNDTSLVVVTEQATPNAGTDGSLTICAGATVTSAQLLGALTGEDAGGSFVEALAGAGTYTYVVIAHCTMYFK